MLNKLASGGCMPNCDDLEVLSDVKQTEQNWPTEPNPTLNKDSNLAQNSIIAGVIGITLLAALAIAAWINNKRNKKVNV